MMVNTRKSTNKQTAARNKKKLKEQYWVQFFYLERSIVVGYF